MRPRTNGNRPAGRKSESSGRRDGDRSSKPGGSFRRTSGDRNEGSNRKSFNREDASARPRRPRTSEGEGFGKKPYSSEGPRFRDRNRGDAPRRSYRKPEGDERPRRPRREGGASEGRSQRSYNSGGPRFRDRGEGDAPRRSFRKSDGDERPRRPRREEGGSEGRGFSKKPFGRRTSGGTDSGRPREERKKSPYYGKPFGPPRGRSSSRSDEPREERPSFVRSRTTSQRRFIREQSEEPREPRPDDLIRLNKFISNSGICSRREADNLITMGLVSVNGTVITELGYKVRRSDDVRYESKRLSAERPVYILLNKPKGFITTTEDPQERNTVMNLIAGACKERVYPVGRLDRNTTGLLLFTNDGELADRLTHPSYNVRKIYKVELNRALTRADFEKIREGVRLEEGKAVVDDLAIVDDDSKTIGIELHIGWNRIVRRIFEALGYEVVKLDRVVYAGLDKKDLPRGKWRFLKETEVVKLKHFGKKPKGQDSSEK